MSRWIWTSDIGTPAVDTVATPTQGVKPVIIFSSVEVPTHEGTSNQIDVSEKMAQDNTLGTEGSTSH